MRKINHLLYYTSKKGHTTAYKTPHSGAASIKRKENQKEYIMNLKEEFINMENKINEEIENLIKNPNHIFKGTVMDDWLNHAAYHCKCTYFDRPTVDEEDVDETTLDQKKWDNILLKDFDFTQWKMICEDEFYPYVINHFTDCKENLNRKTI